MTPEACRNVLAGYKKTRCFENVCVHTFFYKIVFLLCRTRKCVIVALILLFIFLFLWPSKLMFGRDGGQQLLMPHKWLTATSHPLGMKLIFYRTAIESKS